MLHFPELQEHFVHVQLLVFADAYLDSAKATLQELQTVYARLRPLLNAV